MTFYFFRVTLSYFDDKRRTFFITPEQSRRDAEGIPFSESDLKNTVEFKDFVNKLKADVVDVDYTEYAAELDEKNSGYYTEQVTLDIFSELSEKGIIRVVDENQFAIVLRRTNSGSKSGGGTKMLIPIAAIAVVLLIGGFAASRYSKKGESNSSSVVSDISEISEASDISGNNSETDSSAVASSDNPDSSDSVPNETHEPTSGSSSNDSSDSSGSPDSSQSETSEQDTPPVTQTIFSIDEPADMAVMITYDTEQPDVSFIAPDGAVYAGVVLKSETEIVADGSSEEVVTRWYIPNAMAGTWQITYLKGENENVGIHWERRSYVPPEDTSNTSNSSESN